MPNGQEAEQPEDHAQRDELEHGIPARAHPPPARAASHQLAQLSETGDPGEQKGRRAGAEVQVEHPEVRAEYQRDQREAQKDETQNRSEKTQPYLQRSDSIAARIRANRKVTIIA